MLKHVAPLDLLFRALADPARRRMLERLTRGPATVSDLAATEAMSLPAAGQHVKVLQDCGLVVSAKTGRSRTCRIEPQALAPAEGWIAERRSWDERFSRLAGMLAEGETTMTERSIAHGSFTVRRSYPQAPAKVFGAWADPTIKRRWYGGSQQDEATRVFEFRAGGREFHDGVGPAGENYAFELRYYDFVTDARIVYAYEVLIEGVRHSVSIASVEFAPEGSGTALTMTEHGAFLDGHEIPDDRINGANWVLDQLAIVLDD